MTGQLWHVHLLNRDSGELRDVIVAADSDRAAYAAAFRTLASGGHYPAGFGPHLAAPVAAPAPLAIEPASLNAHTV